MNNPLRFVPSSSGQVEWIRDQKHEWLVRDGLTGEGDLAMVRVTMESGQSHETHSHPRMEEILYVLSGRCIQSVGNKEQELGPGDTVHIPMGMTHATHNPFPEPLVFLAVLTPAVFDGNETVDGMG
ncbi:MAG TPA: cupin domain-containing protein [Planctomycetes bacterium]|jgi:quercetin dioxygenase-like cupin family protein|nr:cupin domain-containing protein [Planctomycetota bacterium]